MRVKRPATSRLVGKREIRFIGARCHKDVTEWCYPGPIPQYCGACGPLVKREKTAVRTRRSRQKKKEQQQQQEQVERIRARIGHTHEKVASSLER